MNDTDRIDWLERQDGMALVSDDYGHWACVTDGVQDTLINAPDDISTSFWIRKEDWHSTIREAIDAAYEEYGEENDERQAQ